MNRVQQAVLRHGVSMLARTWRISVRGQEHARALDASGAPFIYALWHSDILPLLWFHRGMGVVLMVSSHRDGGILAGAASGWGFGVVRGSSTRGGAVALRGALRALARGCRVAITPDGPRGPARSCKPGVLKVAELSGSPILPVVASARCAWHLRSWDRFLVPAPGSRVEIRYLEPIRMTGEDDGKGVRERLTCALNGERD